MSYEFQEAHRNYEDMQILSKKVQQWINALEKSQETCRPAFASPTWGGW